MFVIVFLSGVDRLDEELKDMAKKKALLSNAIRAIGGITVLNKNKKVGEAGGSGGRL